jgi:hypothetical protein
LWVEETNVRLMDNSNGAQVWQWFSPGVSGIVSLMMLTDGNLCVHFASRAPECTRTNGHRGAFLSVKDDGHLAVMAGSDPLWTMP